MRTKNITITICCIILAAFALGAAGIINISDESATEQHESGRMIGVFITEKYLDLFDGERYSSENITKLIDGGIIGKAESDRYQRRLYASLAEKSHIHVQSGESVSSKEYIFDGIDGMRFFAPVIDEAAKTCQTSIIDEGITDADVHFSFTDAGKSASLKGNIYIAPRDKEHMFYLNPVYQLPNGKVYAVSGEGLFVDKQIPTTTFRKTASEKQTASDSKTMFYSTEAEIVFRIMNEPTNIAILQFDGQNKLLEKAEYASGALPEHIDLLADTQYIMLETASSKGLSRELFTKEDTSLSAFYRRDDGICLKQSCKINWK